MYFWFLGGARDRPVTSFHAIYCFGFGLAIERKWDETEAERQLCRRKKLISVQER